MTMIYDPTLVGKRQLISNKSTSLPTSNHIQVDMHKKAFVVFQKKKKNLGNNPIDRYSMRR